MFKVHPKSNIILKKKIQTKNSNIYKIKTNLFFIFQKQKTLGSNGLNPQTIKFYQRHVSKNNPKGVLGYNNL